MSHTCTQAERAKLEQALLRTQAGLFLFKFKCTQAERTKREKARKAATNAGKPLWDEDGQRRGLLDKYDEQEEDASMTVGSTGRLEAKLSRADETRQRLAAGTRSAVLQLWTRLAGRDADTSKHEGRERSHMQASAWQLRAARGGWRPSCPEQTNPGSTLQQVIRKQLPCFP